MTDIGLQTTAAPSAGLHSMTVADICRAANISRRMFFLARKVQWAGAPELVREVLDGGVSMNLAVEMLQFDHATQRLILAEFHDIPVRERLSFVRLVAVTRAIQVESDSTSHPAAIGLPSHTDGTCHAGGRP
jgi:AcrR family transcriptional regulator